MASGKTRKTKAKGGTEAAETPKRASVGAGDEVRKKDAKRATGRTGRPKGSRNKPETPGKVVAIGLDVPRLDDLKAAAEAQKAAKDEAAEEKRRPGQPTSYRPEYAATARIMCKLGASDMDLAEEFGVKVQTIWNWSCKHQEFFDALSQGKDAWDDRVERGLAIRAAGYSVHTEKLFCYEGAVVRAETVEHFPPDVGAIKLWLGNRRPDKWKEKQEVKIDSSEAFLRLWTAISDGSIGKTLEK